MEHPFIHKNYYLDSGFAQDLYFDGCASLPIVDFHNHLNPRDLSENVKFQNMADAWVVSDPYKHRAMRIYGIPEEGITGNKIGWEKFRNWAEVLPATMGNPLFLWSALELKRVFNIDDILTLDNADRIYNRCNEDLQNLGVVDILELFNTEILCTSDDLLDDISYHQIANEQGRISVYPSLRGDSMLGFDRPLFRDWFTNLESKTSRPIKTLDDYCEAISVLLDEFDTAGCRMADHAIDGGFLFDALKGNMEDLESRSNTFFSDWMAGNELTTSECLQLQGFLLYFLGKEYGRRNWVLQLHIGAQRYTSSRLRKLAGATGGYAAIGSTVDMAGLCRLFDALENRDLLPRTILYTLNPSDNELMASLTGSYSEDGVFSKIQFGPSWWYNDHFAGIKRQLTVSANYSLLSKFVGMTTDSRSVLSFSRHEYFRRILCNQIAEWVKEGHLPHDIDWLKTMVADISYYNSKKWIFKEL